MISNDIAADRRKWWVCLALAAAVVIAYSGVVHLGFVEYDDNQYIYENPAIQHGLNSASLQWAFTTNWAANWHPLTWFVLIIDYSLFGANPVGYHVANAVWHLLNTLLLFLWLQYATRALWRSAAVAAFFALHPFHVESVAWASERKDVLSTFFWLVSVWLYSAYSRRASESSTRRALFYAASLVAFALGLLAKPMVVTLPCVLLLLDYWPLRRPVPFRRLIVEKIPYFVLSAAACILTVLAQRSGGAVASLERFPMLQRLENVPVAYARYLEKTFWPWNLNFFYSRVGAWPAWIVCLSIAILALISVPVVKRRRNQPWLIVGWLWFLGMLVPTIGILQVGEQSMADRYSYLSTVGIFIMVAWTLADFAINRVWVAPVCAWLADAALLVCSVATFRQVSYWRTTTSLFGRAVEVGQDNYLAYYNLAVGLAKMGDSTNAMNYFERCVQYNPNYPRGFNNLAFLQLNLGQIDPALTNLQRAVQLRPFYPEAWMNLGRAYAAKSDLAHARQSLQTAISQKPDLAQAHYLLGDLLLRQNDLPSAMTNLQSAIEIQPQNADYHVKLAAAGVASRQIAKAVNEYEIALKLNPDLAEACNNLAWILAVSPDASLRDGPLAVELARHAVNLTHRANPLLIGTFAAACAESAKFDDAVAAATQARQLALAQSNQLLAAALAAQIDLYRARQPFRDASLQ
jgi:tetratricopeptide (TPR) repeat protein